MKVLVMNCSPVRNGATAEIVKIVSECLSEKHEVIESCIDDFKVGFCKGCRTCHNTAKCIQTDDTDKIIAWYEWADIIISVAPSYWADVPGQFKVFIDRCTPWCNTHEPHAVIGKGKKSLCHLHLTVCVISHFARILGNKIRNITENYYQNRGGVNKFFIFYS